MDEGKSLESFAVGFTAPQPQEPMPSDAVLEEVMKELNEGDSDTPKQEEKSGRPKLSLKKTAEQA